MIVVTGAAGFIGSAVIWALNKQQQANILAVDVLNASDSWKNLVNLRFADYLDRDDFIVQLTQGRLNAEIEGVIHLGACSSTTMCDAGFLMKNNYEYTRRLCQWCLEHGKRFVYASSAATYGDGARGFDDDHDNLDPLQPLNAYGFSKHQFDRWAKHHGVLDRIVGLKYFNVYGPNEYHKDDMRSVVHKAFGQIQQTNLVKLFKSHRSDYQDGRQLRDFIYVKDAVAATLALYQHPAAYGIFNVGTGQARSFYDLTVATFQAMDREPRIEFIDMPESIRDRYQYFTQANNEKLRRLGIAPTYSLEQGISDYVKNYLLQADPYLGNAPSR